IRDYERTARIGRILFVPGPFGIFAAVKRALFWLLNLWQTIGMPPLSRQELFKWATKSTSGMPESHACCRGAWIQHLSHGRLRSAKAFSISRLIRPVSRDCDGDCNRKEIPSLR